MKEINKIVENCERNIDLANGQLGEEYYYNSLPLCIIDAVYSIGVNYSSTRNTVFRYCDYFKLKRTRADKNQLPATYEQESTSLFIQKYKQTTVEELAEDIFQNKQRTSAVNGILKAEAVYRFAQVLKNKNIEYLQDVQRIINDDEFEAMIKEIPGQKSGISLQYFYMLAGSSDFIKPDRMVLRFLSKILDRIVTLEEAPTMLIEASKVLKEKYPNMTPRLLDHEIWKYESDNIDMKS